MERCAFLCSTREKRWQDPASVLPSSDSAEMWGFFLMVFQKHSYLRAHLFVSTLGHDMKRRHVEAVGGLNAALWPARRPHTRNDALRVMHLFSPFLMRSPTRKIKHGLLSNTSISCLGSTGPDTDEK